MNLGKKSSKEVKDDKKLKLVEFGKENIVDK